MTISRSRPRHPTVNSFKMMNLLHNEMYQGWNTGNHWLMFGHIYQCLPIILVSVNVLGIFYQCLSIVLGLSCCFYSPIEWSLCKLNSHSNTYIISKQLLLLTFNQNIRSYQRSRPNKHFFRFKMLKWSFLESRWSN